MPCKAVTKKPMLGSLTHIDEAGGGPTVWNGLFGDAGLLTDLWTPQGIDSFAYDADGAITSLGDLELEFDQWNNLTAVHDKSINQDYIESYLYDFANRLVGVISSDGYIDLWVHDGQKRAERWRASNSGSIGSAYLMDEYIFGHHPHQLLAATTNESQGGLLFPLSDERHSIIGIWREEKAAFAEYAQYDPDGRLRIRSSEDHINCSEREMQKAPCSFKYLPHFGFTGAFRSTTTGLTHLGARWYSARLGQFISPDPLWYIDSFDLYAYAGFDPINKWDPTGMASRGLASTEQNDRELGTSWGLGTRSQASAENTEWAKPHFAIAVKNVGDSVERFIRRIGDRNGELTHNLAEGAASRHIESTSTAAQFFYGGALYLITFWQVATPQTGDEAMLDAALLAAAPAGRFATRFDDIADGVSALGRAANSEFTDRLLRLHFDESGALRIGKAASAGSASRRIQSVLEETKAQKGNFTSSLALTTDEALEAGELWLGPQYREISPGVFRSADNRRQFRIDDGSISGTHPPYPAHVHIEKIGLNGRDIITNNHIPIID